MTVPPSPHSTSVPAAHKQNPRRSISFCLPRKTQLRRCLWCVPGLLHSLGRSGAVAAALYTVSREGKAVL